MCNNHSLQQCWAEKHLATCRTWRCRTTRSRRSRRVPDQTRTWLLGVERRKWRDGESLDQNTGRGFFVFRRFFLFFFSKWNFSKRTGLRNFGKAANKCRAGGNFYKTVGITALVVAPHDAHDRAPRVSQSCHQNCSKGPKVQHYFFYSLHELKFIYYFFKKK